MCLLVAGPHELCPLMITSDSQLAENLQGFCVEWTQELEDDVMAVYNEFPDPWRVQVAGMG